MKAHPFAHTGKALPGTIIELASRGGADVEQKVTALADPVDEHPYQLAVGLPGLLVAIIAPGAAESLACFPHRRFAFFVDHGALWLVLLGGDEIA